MTCALDIVGDTIVPTPKALSVNAMTAAPVRAFLPRNDFVAGALGEGVVSLGAGLSIGMKL
jgi:transketolase N-terminal domain/subunit